MRGSTLLYSVPLSTTLLHLWSTVQLSVPLLNSLLHRRLTCRLPRSTDEHALTVTFSISFNDTFFQVDMIVVNGTFYAHPKAWNPHPHNITGYWCVECASIFALSKSNPCESCRVLRGG